MLIFHILFWVSLFMIFWTYFGYWFSLWLLSLFYRRRVNAGEFLPGVSLIITVYNEEKIIGKKIENTLALVYPENKLEIIVVSDGSDDRTEEIVRSYLDTRVKFLAVPSRHGKHYAQGKGINMADSDIIIFTDAATFLKEDAVVKIVRNFSDPVVGCVSGKDSVMGAACSSQSEGIYVKYEMKLRSLESQVGSLMGISGSFSAVRKNLCQPWFSDLSSDFYLPITSYMKRYRSILEPEAIGYYETSQDPREEFRRKVRTVVHGLNVLFKFKEIMNPLKYGTYSLQVISHKLLRWLAPICIVLLFVVNLLLLNQNNFYQTLFFCQLLFYAAALSSFFARELWNISLFRIPFFFVMVNLSILMAWYIYLSGRSLAIWESTRR